MTINLNWLVNLFSDFKNDTPWYLKVLVGFILGVILVSSLFYAFFAPGTQPAVAAVPSTAVATSLPTPTWTPVPTATLLPTQTPTPTPETVYVIWSEQAEMVNMRDEPAGNVVATVANGEVVEPLNEIIESGGYTWVKVEVDGQIGWIANFLIWEIEGDYYQIMSETQDYYDSKGGTYKGTLMKGTPYQLLATDEGWIEIELPDGERGWIEG